MSRGTNTADLFNGDFRRLLANAVLNNAESGPMLVDRKTTNGN